MSKHCLRLTAIDYFIEFYLKQALPMFILISLAIIIWDWLLYIQLV